MTEPQMDNELRKLLKRMVMMNRLDQIALRGCLIGIFTAIGTTIGFALFIIIASQFVTQFKEIPLLDSILEQTKLDVLIENQLNKLEQETANPPTDTSVPDSTDPGSTGDTSKNLTYQNDSLGISFEYPSTFNSVLEKQTEDEYTVIQLNGEGALYNLDIYIDKQVVVTGTATQRFVQRDDIDRIVVNIYESGVTIEGQEFTNPAYYSTVEANGHTYRFVGLADENTPKLAREVFVSILQTVSFQ
ncbi:hypothetical protein KC640_02865 [Candidatus Dojkabacteria bacterium]|uniref:Uncharacterized protein n=1 Tax=Candidatus Dojkabacteria bacterium TaxID=2099670 RepID=A0A955I5H2_9BACT|nr:hypothetical protein [Candidatus Dojkabacteria bacterium]